MRVLLTGGAGYIGSHTAVELLNNDHEVVVVDNLCNSSLESINRVKLITGKELDFYEIDLRNQEELDKVFKNKPIDAVIHFAGLKAVGESVSKPVEYYDNNIGSTLVLLQAMKKHNVKKLIFSSSATVYGSAPIPYTEKSPIGIGITNPYGHTKYMIEQILRDLSIAESLMEITILRYFNPIGAHSSGLIGEDPSSIPNNLFPYIAKVAVGKLDKVNVFGNDYDTPDGTGVRDYIHVVDLAKGHVAALHNLRAGALTYNLGTGKGVSVLELIAAFSKASGVDIPYQIASRRPGDLACYYADPTRAQKDLGWKAEKTIVDACKDSWLWQSKNPDGYK